MTSRALRVTYCSATYFLHKMIVSRYDAFENTTILRKLGYVASTYGFILSNTHHFTRHEAPSGGDHLTKSNWANSKCFTKLGLDDVCDASYKNTIKTSFDTRKLLHAQILNEVMVDIGL